MIQYRIYLKSPYANRAGRAEFIIREYGKYLGHSLLDIGGGRGLLKKLYHGNYVNVDKNGNADYILDLEKIKQVPFNNQSFDTIVCTDVFEHLENIHFIFDEICRIARNTIIISLPNGWINVWEIVGGPKRQISKNRRKRLSDLWWTLQVKPLDTRHKWFYSLWEANELIKYRAKKMDFEIIEYNPHIVVTKRLSLFNILRLFHQNIWSPEDFVNIYARTGWWVLRRKGQ